jgi:hypothetical protein
MKLASDEARHDERRVPPSVGNGNTPHRTSGCADRTSQRLRPATSRAAARASVGSGPRGIIQTGGDDAAAARPATQERRATNRSTRAPTFARARGRSAAAWHARPVACGGALARCPAAARRPLALRAVRTHESSAATPRSAKAAAAAIPVTPARFRSRHSQQISLATDGHLRQPVVRERIGRAGGQESDRIKRLNGRLESRHGTTTVGLALPCSRSRPDDAVGHGHDAGDA